MRFADRKTQSGSRYSAHDLQSISDVVCLKFQFPGADQCFRSGFCVSETDRAAKAKEWQTPAHDQQSMNYEVRCPRDRNVCFSHQCYLGNCGPIGACATATGANRPATGALLPAWASIFSPKV